MLSCELIFVEIFDTEIVPPDDNLLDMVSHSKDNLKIMFKNV